MMISEILTVSPTYIGLISTRVENVPYCVIFSNTNQAILQHQSILLKYIYIFTNAQPLGSNAGLLHKVINYKNQICLHHSAALRATPWT